MSELPSELVERILTKLGLSKAPELTLVGLQSIYSAWCHSVPFDNLRKMIHVRSGDTGPLPGDEPVDFFEFWLRHGTGGTCWAGNGSLCALLSSLNFQAARGLATMMVAPNLPPNHGTVVVSLDDTSYIVDASILHNVPLPLLADGKSAASAFGAELHQRDSQWYIWWHPTHLDHKIDCRIDLLEVPREEYHVRHEQSRGWSPFNYELRVRKLRNGLAMGVATDHIIEITTNDEFKSVAVSASERKKILVEQFGYSSEIVEQLPPDLPTPPPPGSHKAQATDTGVR
ncbi:MAG: arylamine N-acetyltransferase [Candidatus Obscuribacterales bacterium]|nr:arylamine N-acetyltransferase [Candidatus Obscuribacterales bacterium]